MDRKKGVNEFWMANNILGIISNLDDTDEALEYARLYLKAQKEAVRTAEPDLDFDKCIKEIYKLLAETDSRFEDEEGEDSGDLFSLSDL